MIFNISPHRSATRSLTEFCEAAGLRTLHWEDALDAAAEQPLAYRNRGALWAVSYPYLKGAEVFSDLPWPLLYSYAAREFPDAKFVLILRPVEAWIASVRRHVGDRGLSYLEKFFYWTMIGREEERLIGYSDLEMERAYIKHASAASSLIAPGRLGMFMLTEPDVGERLKRFLGLKTTETFRKTNVSASS